MATPVTGRHCRCYALDVALQFSSVTSSQFRPGYGSTRVIEAFGCALRGRDRHTHAHAERVSLYARALARAVGIDEPRALDAIDGSAVLHDVGKLGIPDRLLDKPGPLAPHEFDLVKQHTILGAEMLAAARLPHLLCRIVRHHHERWDGSGYPDGLCGESIPVGARVVAVADCYDALRSDRPYRSARSHDEAVAFIVQGRGTSFDPSIAELFVAAIDIWRGQLFTHRTNAGTV